jgi:quinol monooxygenase YgiN
MPRRVKAADDDPVMAAEGVRQHVLIIHEVAAYPAWKRVFDRAAEIRQQAGEISYQLLREETDPNNIVHFSRWSSLAAARRFFESPELVEIRAHAGVKAPAFIYLTSLEQGVLSSPSSLGPGLTRQEVAR